MAKILKIGDEVRLTKSMIAKRQKEYPGFKPSATTGFVVGTGVFAQKSGNVVVAISDGESYNLPAKDLTLVKSAPKGYKHPNAPNIKRVEAFTEELHGSGINFDWRTEETKTSFRASNAFSTMDEHGGYEGIVDFTVIFPKKASMEDFTLQFAAASQYQAQKHNLTSSET